MKYMITFLAGSVSTKELAVSFLLLLPDFFIPEKDGEHWEPSIYKGRD